MNTTKQITFVIPLRAPQSCNNWEQVSTACVGTLQSIANQSSGNYQCLLVCHEPPPSIPSVNNFEIVRVNYPVPKTDKERKQDKGLKIRQALEYLKCKTSVFSMNLDADDRIHHDLVRFVESNETGSGWRIGKGYVYPGGKWLRAHNGSFDSLCGSSIICRVDDLSETASPILWGHCQAQDQFKQKGTPLTDVPFYAAVKVVGYGDNITETKFLWSESIKRTMKKTLMMRPVSSQFKKNFAFDTNPVPK